MYRRYYNEYEKRADEIRRAAQIVESKSETPLIQPQKQIKKQPPNILHGFKTDDILLGVLIFFLIREEKPDQMLILALAFIFISGF